MKTKILIVEPSAVIVAGLQAVLARQSRFDALTPLHSTRDLEGALAAHKPHIAILNPTLDEQAASLCAQAGVKTAALVYQYVEPARVKAMDAVLDIRDDVGTLISKLTELADRHITSADDHKPESYELTRRELDVLIEVARGKTNKEIADDMNVSIHTIITHRKNIGHKTGIKSVAGLTMYAMLNHLI